MPGGGFMVLSSLLFLLLNMDSAAFLPGAAFIPEIIVDDYYLI